MVSGMKGLTRQTETLHSKPVLSRQTQSIKTQRNKQTDKEAIMAFEQTNITKDIAQVAAEAARVAAKAMTTTNADDSQRLQNAVPKIHRPIMKQPTFNWEADDKQ